MTRPIKLPLADLPLPAYFSQLDPEPRLIANQQLQALERAGLLRLTWLPGETGHLLAAVALSFSPGRDIPGETRNTEHAIRNLALSAAEGTDYAPLYRLLGRTPLADRRARLESLLLGEKFRFPADDWRSRALRHILSQLKAGKSPAPFSLSDTAFDEDLLTALIALADLHEETPYRVISVRLFNDSKRLDDLKSALVRLARLGNPEWKRLSPDDVLRELNLVANPTYVHLSGPWELVDADGQLLSLGGFSPSVGLPAAQAARLQRVTVRSPAVLCIENPTTFYETIRNTQYGIRNTQHADSYSVLRIPYSSPCTLCLSGNPSPAARHLLHLVPEDVPLLVWADLDYGGFNILAQLRKQVSPRAQPYRMDIGTLEAHAALAHPLTPGDRRNLERISRRPELRDVQAVIHYLLERGLKLEQEAILLAHAQQ